MNIHFKTLVTALCIIAYGALASSCVAAGTTSAYFPFVIPWDDATAHVPTDVSFLNRPIEPIIARDGHFFGKVTGRRIRFVAVDFAADANFPSHADAEKVAVRLAKYGVNLIRMHHMDNEWWQKSSIWDYNYKDHRHIDPGQRDRMDYLIAQLEKHGIYVDINLHVSRQFTQADGFPASVEQIPFGYDKRVDQFDLRMIDLQKEYARDLLTHVNPYTHKAYTDDPGVAMVEINNENSLVGDPWATLGAGLDQLPPPYDSELINLWNDWLHRQYASDDALKAAWTKGVTPSGPSIVGPDAKWSIEVHGGAGTLDTTPAAGATAPDIETNVTAVDGTSWHIQAKIDGLTVQNGETYTVRFRARADSPRSVDVNLQLGEPDWRLLGFDASVPLTSDWKDYQYSFTATDAEPGYAKLSFLIGGGTGRMSVSDLTLSPGMPNAGIAAGQSLSASNISIPATGASPAGEWRDWITFLGDTEKTYADGMRDYLKSSLGVRGNIIESQLGFGGMTSVRREIDMDYADNHAYWQHPRFPHKAWDPVDWNIENTSMVADLAKGGGGTLRNLAEYRIAGKPYTISEYNHPAPSDFQAETVPIIFSYAAAQDWDAVFLFDYGNYGEGSDNDKIQGYFAVGGNPAKMGFLPAAAMLFRADLIEPLGDLATCTIPVAGRDRDAFGLPSNVWKQPAPFLDSRIALTPVDRSGAPPAITQSARHSSTTVGIRKLGDDPVYVAAGPRGQALAGFVGGHSLTVGAATYDFDDFGNRYAAVMLAPMDAETLTKSKHLLLTVVGRVENQDMGWNGTRTSVGNQWGHAPVSAENIPGSVTLTVDGPRVVHALTPTGTLKAIVPSQYLNGKLTFRIGDNQTLWYSIETR